VEWKCRDVHDVCAHPSVDSTTRKTMLGRPSRGTGGGGGAGVGDGVGTGAGGAPVRVPAKQPSLGAVCGNVEEEW